MAIRDLRNYRFLKEAIIHKHRFPDETKFRGIEYGEKSDSHTILGMLNNTFKELIEKHGLKLSSYLNLADPNSLEKLYLNLKKDPNLKFLDEADKKGESEYLLSEQYYGTLSDEARAAQGAEPVAVAQQAMGENAATMAGGGLSFPQTSYGASSWQKFQKQAAVSGKAGGTGEGVAATNKAARIEAEKTAKTPALNKFVRFQREYIGPATAKAARIAESKIGIFLKQNLTAGRLAAGIGAGIGGFAGAGLTGGSGVGIFGGAIGGAVFPSWVKSGGAGRFFNRVGGGVIDFTTRLSNQAGWRFRSAAGKKVAGRKVLLLLVPLVVAFAIFAAVTGLLNPGGIPTGTGGAGSSGFIGGSGCPDTSANRTEGSCRYLNPSIDIFDTNISQQSIDTYIQNYKNRFIGKTLTDGSTGTEEEFKRRVGLIVSKAQSAGLNPALILAFWKSENAFSTIGRAGNDFGCRAYNPEITTFEEDLLCAVGLRSEGKTYTPSVTVSCATSKDASSKACQSLKQGRVELDKTHPIKYPISTFDDFMESYGPYDHLNKGLHTNCTHTYNLVLDVAKEVGACKLPAGGNTDSVLHWARIINEDLIKEARENRRNIWDRMTADITNNGYTATKRSGASEANKYWCTYLVIDSYNLAGIKGLKISEHGGVFRMLQDWKKMPGYLFIPYTGTTEQKIDALKKIKPGYALLRVINESGLSDNDHASILDAEVKLDSNNDGAITTIDSNGQSSWKSFIRNGQIVNWEAPAPIRGFGGIVGSLGTPKSNPVIVLDPGHSGESKSIIDAATGLIDFDYPNIPEIDEVFDVTLLVRAKLEADGYTVIMTKKTSRDYVSLRDRADIANNANADLAVSIHSDHGARWDSFAQVYTQKMGLYRETKEGTRKKFENAAVAQKSQQYGQIFAQERAAAEGRPVALTDVNFTGRQGLAGGNIPLVQLFANVPWVYNEVGADGKDARLSQEKIITYAQGLINAIKKSVPITKP